MPYNIVKSGSGYKVKSPHRTFSEKPMSKSKAKKQLAAIQMNTHGESFEQRLSKILNELFDPEKAKISSLSTGAYNSIAALGSNDINTFFNTMRDLIKQAKGTEQEQYLNAIIQTGHDFVLAVQQAQIPTTGPRNGINDPQWDEFSNIRDRYFRKLLNLWEQMTSTVSDAHAAYHTAKQKNTLRPHETGNDVLRRQNLEALR